MAKTNEAERPWRVLTPHLTYPDRPQALADIVEALQRAGVVVSYRMLDDAIRTEPELPMPKPFGTIGRNRLWHAMEVESALPALCDWFTDAPERRSQRHRETLEKQKRTWEESVAIRQQQIAKEMQQKGEFIDLIQSSAEDNRREREGLPTKRGGSAIVPFSTGSR